MSYTSFNMYTETSNSIGLPNLGQLLFPHHLPTAPPTAVPRTSPDAHTAVVGAWKLETV